MKRNSIDWTPLFALVVFSVLTFFVTWLVITFWQYLLIGGGVLLVIWAAPRIGWWLALGRVQYRTRRALRRDSAAYQQARDRMLRIAQRYRGW
jgi:hypothetical protein